MANMSNNANNNSSNSDSFLAHAVACSLIDMLDRELICVLRDGRQIIGYLVTFDQYSNIVLNKAKERRIFNNKYYSEDNIGLYIIRGENIVMLGNINRDKLNNSPYSIEANPSKYIKISAKELRKMEQEERKQLIQQGVFNEIRDEEYALF